MKWVIADLDLSKNLSFLLKRWKLIWVVNRYLAPMLWIVINENEKLKDRGAKVRR